MMEKLTIKLVFIALFSIAISACGGSSGGGGGSGGDDGDDGGGSGGSSSIKYCEWNDPDSKWDSCTLSALVSVDIHS